MDNIGRESETKEFKKSMSELGEGLISLVAMLNKNGVANVYFGVKDNGDVIGIQLGKNTVKDITDKIYERIEPSVIAKIDILESNDGLKYILVTAKGNNRPYSYEGVIYVRTGESDRKAPLSELRRMILSSGDNLIETTSLNHDLTFKELCNILRDNGNDVNDDERLRNSLNLVNDQGEYNFQAFLLSDQNNIPLTAVVFNGFDRTSLSIRKDYSGHCILSEMKSVQDYVLSLNETYADMTVPERKDVSLFDEKAFEEAWINACVHNNWITHMAPTVHIFDDRIEIISYGSIPYWLSMDDFYNGKSMPVNDSLMRVFIQTGFAEHTGHGIPVITSAYGKDAFRISDGSICVTLRFKHVRYSASLRENMNVPLTDKEMAVLDAIRMYPKGTLDEYSRVTGISTSTIGKITVRLKEKKLIERVGNKRSGFWKVNE